MRAVVLCMLVWVAASIVSAEEPYDLDEVQFMEGFVGSEEARRLLAQQGMVVTDQQFKQVFEAYTEGGVPFFITVDSAWHTYHVLLEEGLRAMEQRQAAVLEQFSERLYQAARKARGPSDAVRADLSRFAAVGWVLQNREGLETLGESEKGAVAEVVRQLDGEQDWIKALFFELPVSPQGLRATSFYAEDAALRGYFAARQWYATCDFRLCSEGETERALCLVALIEGDAELKSLHRKLTEPYDVLLGPPDDAGVREYASVAEKLAGGKLAPEEIPGRLADFRREAATLPDPKVNDQFLLPEQYAEFAENTKGFRLFPPRRLPSAVLFQRTVDPLVKGRLFPSGIDLFAAGPLACDAGRRALRTVVNDPAMVRQIEAAEGETFPDSLHGKALGLFRQLQDPLPKGAPEPLRSEAWQDKQLATALAGWAEQRHTWALQSKMTRCYGAMVQKPPGYVSPYPGFFRHLGRLSRATADVLQTSGDRGPEPKAVAKKLLAGVDLLRKLTAGDAPRTAETYDRMMQMSEFVAQYRDGDFPRAREEAMRCCDELEKLARRWSEATELGDRDRELMALLVESSHNVKGLLQEFADLCDKLAAIATKELENRPLGDEDRKLIRDYGETLARFHFYGGNSWLTPRDDLPMIAPVYAFPFLNETLYAGVARPESLWVILSYEGQPVLHCGAVLTYRELRRPTNQPLDDESWTGEVRRGEIPPPPAFTRSFRKAISVEEVVRMIRAGQVYPAVNTMPDRAITRAMIETLLEGKAKTDDFAHWLRESLCVRARDEDVAGLLQVLQKTPVDNEDLGEIAMYIAELNWTPHRDAVMGLLRHKTIQYADSAAYIFSQRPENIDLAALASTYDDQEPCMRRLYCYVLGHWKQADRASTELLLKMLGDENATVRYQAALAAASRGLRQKEIDGRLIAGLADPYAYVAAVMARALVDLEVKEAAPPMLARLKELAAGRNVPLSTGWEHDFPRNSRYSGSLAITALSERKLNKLSLTSELIAALAAFRYTPAGDQLRSMLQGQHGAKALDALVAICPAEGLDLAMQVALAEKAERVERCNALRLIASEGDRDCIERLFPLLKEPATQREARRSVCGDAAEAIGRLLAKQDADDPQTKKIRQVAIAQIRNVLRGCSGRKAMKTLIRIDPAGRNELLFELALDEKAHDDVRIAALHEIGNVFADDKGKPIDPNRAVELLPVLSKASTRAFGGRKVFESAALAIASLAAEGASDETRQAIERKLREMLHGEYGGMAVHALLRLEPQNNGKLLLKVAFDRQLPEKTRASAIQQIGWQNDRGLILQLAPLLDEKSEALAGQRICDLATEAILLEATSASPMTPEVETPALKKLRAQLADLEGKTPEETREGRIQAARQWATVTGED